MSDTLPAWLFNRFGSFALPGDPSMPYGHLDDDDKLYWEHQAAAVRRAVARDGFKLSRHATMLETERE